MKAIGTLLILILLAPAGTRAAAANAPLPAQWTSSNDDEAKDGYVPPPAMRGIYGHGRAKAPGFSLPEEPICKGDEAAVRAVAERLGGDEVEFWFYATPRQGVLFRQTSTVDPAKPCAEAVSYMTEVSRAFVADGLIHSFEVSADQDYTMAETRSATSDDSVYGSAFQPIHNLMARRDPPRRGPVTRRNVAGHPALCGGFGGLVWQQLCVAQAPRSIAGMIVYSAAGDDVTETLHLEFDRLDPSATLDGRLFETDREWRGPGERE